VTLIPAYGGGTPLGEYAAQQGARPVNNDFTGLRAMAADPDWVEPETLDPKYCQATSSKTNSQCQAYPIAGHTLCVGHRNAAEKQEREASATSQE